MVVIGVRATIIEYTGLHADVSGFTQELTCNKIPIVDAAVAYDCPYSLKTYLLVMKNALYVPSMGHNLIPPFIMREAGLQVNETAKIHATNPSKNHHSIFEQESGLRIPLQLSGVFSYFPSRALNSDEIEHPESYEMIWLTPNSDSWNPYNDIWAEQESSYLDQEGEIIPQHIPQQQHLIDATDVEVSAVQMPSVDAYEAAVDAVISSAYTGENPQDCDFNSHAEECLLVEDAIRAHISSTNFTSDPALLESALDDRLLFSKFATAMGSTTIDNSGCELFEAVTDATVGATAGKPRGITAEQLAKVWTIDHKMAEKTLEVTTQLHRGGDSSLARNFGTNDRMLRYRRIKSWFFTDTFFVTKAAKSVRGNTCMQLFVSDKGFVKAYPMESVSQYPKALRAFAKDVGAPEILVADPHPNQKSKEVKDFCNKIGTTLRLLEQSTQWANRAELYIGLLKESVRKDMRDSHSPLVLWDYCAERRASIFTLTARDLFQLNGTNPYTATFGEEGDISNLCQFAWYEWVYYYDDSNHSSMFPFPKATLGRCLGPAKNEGNEMTQWVLKYNGQVVPRRTLQSLTPQQLAPSNEVEARKRADFDANIKSILGDSFTLPPADAKLPQQVNWEEVDYYDDEPYQIEQEDSVQVLEADCVDNTGKPILQQSLHDTLVQTEVLLPQGEDLHMAKVLRRSMDENGRVIGNFNENPLLNTLVYDCEFPDGTIKKYSANIIAENVLSQVDPDGYYSTTMDSILDHKRDGSAVRKQDKYIFSRNGQRKLRQTTVGWQFKIKWKNGRTEWVPLKLLKESNPVDVAEYVSARDLQDEAAFAWWVPYTLRKRDVIISAISSRVRKKTHKYGIEIPRTQEEARQIDLKNKNTFWQDAIMKEMKNVGVAFEILPEGKKAPPGYIKASGHLVFDVKMDFTRKARWVKDGHRTPDPLTSGYAGVVSRESVRIALTYAALNGLDVWAADIQNAYLQAPSSEKHYVICGPEFGLENVGKVALIKRALYGGKVAGRDFWLHLRSCMEHLGFKSSLADPDVWYRPATKEDGSEHYEYVLLYVDDCLVISNNAENILRREIGKHFKLKEESIGPPTQYLGGKLRQVKMTNGQDCWAFGSTQYVQAAVNNVEEYLAKSGKKLQARAPTPLANEYRPEIDMSDECNEDDASYYHSLIGVLRWIVELGRADICCEVSMMSSHLALPRVGHLEQVLHIFAYLKKHSNSEMVFDPSQVDFDRSQFPDKDWSQSIYSQDQAVLKETLPADMPKPRGVGFTMRTYVDSDHAGDKVTRRSRSGFLVFLNAAPIYWTSKKQTSCETSTFGSEFVAMKQASEYVRGLRYKLRMMGIPVEEPTYIFGDNQSVLANTSAPESTLKKKSNAIAYHFVREGCARDEWRTAYINTHENPADMMTKPLPSGEKRWKFIRMLLYHL